MARGKFEYWLTEDGLTLLTGWARDGLTDEQIAEKMGIAVKTLYEWKKRYGKICEALKRGGVQYSPPSQRGGKFDPPFPPEWANKLIARFPRP